MAIDVAVASTDTFLTSTAALKSMLNTTSTGRDAYMSVAIGVASRRIESYLNRGPLTVQTYRETVAGFGGRRLMLSRRPLRAIKAVYDATDTGTAVQLHTSEFLVEDREAGFLARDQGFAWSATRQPGGGGWWGGGDAIPLAPEPVPGQEYKPWLVDYVAGWAYGGVSTDSPNWSTEAGTTSTGRTLPEDVEYAAMLRSRMTFDEDDQHAGVKSESLGDLSVEYNAGSTGDDAGSWQGLLGPYRSW